jgi:hypothetical protein
MALLRVFTIKNKNPLAVVVTDYTNQLPGSALFAPCQREPHSCFEMFAAVRLLQIDALEACLYRIVWGGELMISEDWSSSRRNWMPSAQR